MTTTEGDYYSSYFHVWDIEKFTPCKTISDRKASISMFDFQKKTSNALISLGYEDGQVNFYDMNSGKKGSNYFNFLIFKNYFFYF